jgi:hypothetical protein
MLAADVSPRAQGSAILLSEWQTLNQLVRIFLLYIVIAVTFMNCTGETIAKKNSKDTAGPNGRPGKAAVNIDQAETQEPLSAVQNSLKSPSQQAKLAPCSGSLTKQTFKVGEPLAGTIILTNPSQERKMGDIELVVMGSEGIEDLHRATYEIPPGEFVQYAIERGPHATGPGPKAFIVKTSRSYEACRFIAVAGTVGIADQLVVKVDQTKPTRKQLRLTAKERSAVQNSLKSPSQQAKLALCSGPLTGSLTDQIKVGKPLVPLAGTIILTNPSQERAIGQLALMVVGRSGIEDTAYATYEIPPGEFVQYAIERGPHATGPGPKAFIVKTSRSYEACRFIAVAGK